MRKNLLLASLLFTGGLFTMNAQTVLFEDGFEDHNDFIITGIGDWITIDVDGLGTYSGGGGTFNNQFEPKAFMVFNPTTAGVTDAQTGVGGSTENRDFAPHGGNKYMGSWASNGGANDDWLISPAITLGNSGNEVKFWVKSMSDSYGLETYQVGVYSGSGTPMGGADFTIISGGTNLQAPFPNWEEKTFSLDAYSGETIRIGIHCNSNDRYLFMVDDFSVSTTGTVSVDNVLAGSFSVYPNPVKDMLNISNSIGAEINSVTITDINGRTVKQVTANGVESQINIADLNAGVYFVNINSNQGNLTKKVVKK